MMVPPPYPRIPYLADDPSPYLGAALRVEEKLDGANVALWLDDDRVRVASRGGPDAMDRANQIGRLRAWASEKGEAVRELCRDSSVVYAEWLWVQHGVAYDRLPDWLVVLDLWTQTDGNVSVETRNKRVREVDLLVPPLVDPGAVLASADEAAALVPSSSAWGSTAPEGVVLRRSDGRRCKVVRRGFEQRSDASWADEPLHNTVR